MDLLNLISDIYCEKDLLGFDKYIDTLSKMITHKNFRTPFCIGVFGKWGSGKTSFMHLLEKKLSEDTTKTNTIAIIPIWFNPWRYEKEEHLIIPFLKSIEHGIERYMRIHEGIGKTLLKKLKESCLKLWDASRAFAFGITAEAKLCGIGIELDTSKMVEREEEFVKKRIEDAKKVSEKYASLYYEIVDELKKTVDEEIFRIVVFIDDLDRCLPDKAIELLEAIKLFLDIEGYLFILGVDKEVVKKGISYRYRFFEHREEKEKEGLVISPEDYLDKMIQLPIELPVIEHGRKRKYIENLLGESEGFKQYADVIIAAGIGENPRTVKRFINLLTFTVNLAETLKDSIIYDRVEPVESNKRKELLKKHFNSLMYLKWTIIVFRYPQTHNDIKGNKRILIELQKAARGEVKVEDEKVEGKGIQIDESLKKVLARGEAGKGELFPEDGDDVEWLIERFIHLTESTVISEKDRSATKGYRQSFHPGDMVLIPKGKFLYGDDKLEKEINYDYEIGIYPVTNGEYKQFVDAMGHRIPSHWTKDQKTFPGNKENHPVVNVSYDDVITYCKWKSKKEGYEYKLPTEYEWEKAARGEDGRVYPWGNDFDEEKCNCNESGISKTTPVDKYPDGVSPYGCYDMAGNVWEWTESWYDEKKPEKFSGAVTGEVVSAAAPIAARKARVSGATLLGFVAPGCRKNLKL